MSIFCRYPRPCDDMQEKHERGMEWGTHIFIALSIIGGLLLTFAPIPGWDVPEDVTGFWDTMSFAVLMTVAAAICLLLILPLAIPFLYVVGVGGAVIAAILSYPCREAYRTIGSVRGRSKPSTRPSPSR